MITPVPVKKVLLPLSILVGTVSACDTWLDAGLPFPTAPSGESAPADSGVSSAPETPNKGTRWIFKDDIDNARDLGGVALADGKISAYDVVFRGPPLTLSPAGCREFADLGIRTIVDLRSAAEREAEPDAECAQSAANVVLAPLAPMQSYTNHLSSDAGHDAILKTFGALGDPEAYPVYIHCTLGRDRSGVMSALILSALGATRADVAAEYKLSSASVGAYPWMLSSALDLVDSQGGTQAFLEQKGVTPQQLETLRAVGTTSID